ncbi:GNAT family N-acetyltransferase [Streptomyces sp. 6N223]|uniref:GNAT family N-acetyltransferase n=1 Tax=Streptomyces sp. 6N223 TaxID=3457412 RepID=UPI003FD362E4
MDQDNKHDKHDKHDPAVAHVPERQRYEITADGERAGFTAYVENAGQRIFYHTEIDERFQGRGLGGALVEEALVDTRDAGRRIVPVCPFVAKYVSIHHEVDDALDPVTPAVREALAAGGGRA